METSCIVFDSENRSDLGRIVLAGILSANERSPQPTMRLLGRYASFRRFCRIFFFIRKIKRWVRLMTFGWHRPKCFWMKT